MLTPYPLTLTHHVYHVLLVGPYHERHSSWFFICIIEEYIQVTSLVWEKYTSNDHGLACLDQHKNFMHYCNSLQVCPIVLVIMDVTAPIFKKLWCLPIPFTPWTKQKKKINIINYLLNHSNNLLPLVYSILFLHRQYMATAKATILILFIMFLLCVEKANGIHHASSK